MNILLITKFSKAKTNDDDKGNQDQGEFSSKGENDN